MPRYTIPLIKEERLEMITQSLRCISENTFNRTKQIECVLTLYRSNSEKGVFRGMVITTLGKLGLIVGTGKAIKVSENGILLLETEKLSRELHRNAQLSVFLEIDCNSFLFLDGILSSGDLSYERLLEVVRSKVEPKYHKTIRERTSRWLHILNTLDFVHMHNSTIALNYPLVKKVKEMRTMVMTQYDEFLKALLISYSKLAKDRQGIVGIEELRTEVAVLMVKKNSILVTQLLFDKMLRKVIEISDSLTFIFGQPMGKGEKLYKSNDNFYSTIYIKKKGND